MKVIAKELIELINRIIEREVINLDKIDQDFGVLGIDSIEMMNILFEVQEKYNIDNIPDDDYQKLNTLSDLVKYIENLNNN
jgi:acyl carrier protein